MADNALLVHALSTATRGFPVFRLVKGGKTPAYDGWQAEATTDPDQIRKLWGDYPFNVGVLTGRGLVVLDVDVKKGKQGLESYERLNLDASQRDTLVVRTPSGGRHEYYRTEQVVGNTAGRLGDGLDTRGDGGYVVGPGSVCVNGEGSGAYTIERDRPVAGLPANVSERLRVQRSQPSKDVVLPGTALDSAQAVERARYWLQHEAPIAIEGQGGDHTTFTVAARLRDFGLSRGTATTLMLDHWNDRSVPPWAPDALEVKVDNAYAYAENPPGVDSPGVSFAGVNVEPPPPVTKAKAKWFRAGEDVGKLNVEWTFYKIMPRRGLMVLVGPSQSGKTFLELELARCLATGKPFFNIAPDDQCGTVFLFAGSEGSGLEQRVAALGEKGPLPISATAIQDLGQRDALKHLYEEIKGEAERMMLIHGVPLRLVVIETLAASGLLANEDDNAEAARAMANLGMLSDLLDVVVLTTHHPPKDKSGSRGASSIPAAADYIWEIYRPDRDPVRKLDQTKARDAEQMMIGAFTLLETQLGRDSRGRPITSTVVSMGEAQADRPSRFPAKMEAFTRALDFSIEEAPETLPDGSKGASYQDVLDTFKELTPEVTDRSNQGRMFRKCVEFAVTAGSIDDHMVNGVRCLIRKDFGQ